MSNGISACQNKTLNNHESCPSLSQLVVVILIWLCHHVLSVYQHECRECWSLFPLLLCSRWCVSMAGYIALDDVIKWKHFPSYWPFVWGICRSPRKSPHQGQWGGTLMFSLICAWINGWVNTREPGDLRRHSAHYDVAVMILNFLFIDCHIAPTLSLSVLCRNKGRINNIAALYKTYKVIPKRSFECSNIISR